MLHPQCQALLDLITLSGLPPTHLLSPEEARKHYRDRRGYAQPAPPEVALSRDLAASGPHGAIPLRLVRPRGSSATDVLPVLVYYHGGGWVIGDLDTHDTLCRELANGSGCAVVAVDYRMAPEHRFPTAVDDCLAAAHWVHDHAAELRLDASRLAVGGDSAGGNLAAVVSIASRGDASLPIAWQLLIYPAVDQHRSLPSHVENAQGYLLTADTMNYFAGHYIAQREQYDDWRASPLRHPDLGGLPPALVLTAGFDPLRDEGHAYARRLSDSGNRVACVSFNRQIHGFITMGRVIDEAQTAVALCAAELRRALQPGR